MMHKVIAVGRLGRDPYTTTTKNGHTFTTFPIATDGPKETTWFKVNTWGKLAEVCGQYLTKGRLVYVEGTVDVDLWRDREGNARADLVITARGVKFLDGNGHRAGADIDEGHDVDAAPVGEDVGAPFREPEASDVEPQSGPAPVAEAAEQEDTGDDVFDFDDLPF